MNGEFKDLTSFLLEKGPDVSIRKTNLIVSYIKSAREQEPTKEIFSDVPACVISDSHKS